MPPLNIMIKPASGNCNMRCKYCFYEDEIKHRNTPNFGMMELNTLKNIVKKGLAYSDGSCTFGFQGGEPTLRGIEYFQALIEYEKQYNVNNVRINNAIQTNGILIDEQWAKFFYDNNFLIGLSVDGNKDIHDLNRIDKKGEGTFSHVIKAIELLDKYDVKFNVLTVVTSLTARKIDQIYNFFMKRGMVYQQYIPCLDSFGEERGRHPYSLTPEKYLIFLKRLFDNWYNDRKIGKFVYIRYFENLAGMLLGHPPESCGLLGRCTLQNVIEADGSIYPCDFYMLDQYCLGNLNTDSITDIENKRKDIGFINQSLKVEDECKICQWYKICYGGCRRDRQHDLYGPIGKNYYCSTYKEFFPYIIPRLLKLCQ